MLVGDGCGSAQRAVATRRADRSEVAGAGGEDGRDVVVRAELAHVGGGECGAQGVDRVGRPRGAGVGVHGDAHSGTVGGRSPVGVGDAVGPGRGDVPGPAGQHHPAQPQPAAGDTGEDSGDEQAAPHERNAAITGAKAPTWSVVPSRRRATIASSTPASA